MCLGLICKFWQEIKKIIRFKFGVIYFVTGIILLGIFLGNKVFNILDSYWPKIIWCAGWALFGIGCGLINSRYDDINEGKSKKDRKKNVGGPAHYLFYFLFVGFIATLTAFVALEAYEDSEAKFYAVAALVAVVLGFTGDKLAGKLFELSGRH
ncbi:MAG: hypothetical protein PHR73_04170 [Candidatus Omnitrophica bacterium]|nr:hypothetical protein [Candidatus Omnitrophota bacterium]